MVYSFAGEVLEVVEVRVLGRESMRTVDKTAMTVGPGLVLCRKRAERNGPAFDVVVEVPHWMRTLAIRARLSNR
jgi:hypothetical protein